MIKQFSSYLMNNTVSRSRLAKGWVLMLTAAFLLCGCGDDAAAEESVAGKVYAYTGEPFSDMDGDLFRIAVNEDGTFSYCESMFSSYLGFGTWKIEDGILILTDNAQTGYAIHNSFRVDGEELVFVEEDSTNFIYVKVRDGERFASVGDMEG
ncbi:MAG: hypothetical protein K2L18_11750 [Acetatifactor sp.]|nr:hypothetical protein [Acetatifactor sp.]